MWFLCMPLFGEIQAKGLEDYGPIMASSETS